MTDPITSSSLPGAPNLAVDVVPTVATGTFTLDVSFLDDPDLLGWAAADTWINVVCDVQRVHYRRGASRVIGVLTRSEAGVATVTVEDSERRFDPIVNADAIHPGTPFRVRAWGGTNPAAPDWSAVLFAGTLDDLPVVYQRSGPPIVTLTASDAIADLAEWKSVGLDNPGAGDGDTLRTRVARVLGQVQTPVIEISADSDTAYAATMPASNLASAWDDINAAVDAELGRVWVDSANRLVLRGRESQLSGPVRGTLSDWHGETVDTSPDVHCCYDELAPTLGTEQMINRAIGARRVPTPATGQPAAAASAVVQLDDEISQAAARKVATIERRTLELRTDDQIRPWAMSLLTTAARPQLRIDSVSPAPWNADAEAWQAVCSTDIGDRWALRYHPEQGPTVARTIGVLGIDADLTPTSWSLTWQTVDAPTPGVANSSGWFVLDASELDSGDLLARFGGTVAAPPA